MKELIIKLIAFVALSLLVLVGWYYIRPIQSNPPVEVVDTVTVVDTVKYYQPVAKDSLVVRYVERELPTVKTDTVVINGDTIYISKTDTVKVEVPIEQKMYVGDEYIAYISGYEPNLDSIEIYKQTDYITKKTYLNQRRWGLTAGVGVGATNNGIKPFVGLTFGYKIW